MLATSCSRRLITSSWDKLVSSLAGPTDSFCSQAKAKEEGGGGHKVQPNDIEVEIYTCIYCTWVKISDSVSVSRIGFGVS